MISTISTLPFVPDIPHFKPTNIPPPCPMKWQLSINDPQCLTVDTTPFRSKAPSANIEVLKPRTLASLPIRCNEQSMAILKQFGDCNDYGSCYSAVVDGYIRNLQNEVPFIIPTDINNLCASFYYEEENKYIQIAYKLFKLLRNSLKTDNDTISGTELVHCIQQHLCDEIQSDEIDEICNNLLKFGLLEVVSYQTSFFSLFNNNAEHSSVFKDSEHYKYQLTLSNIKAFESFETL